MLKWHKPETEVRAREVFIRDRYVRAMRRESVVVKNNLREVQIAWCFCHFRRG